MAALLAGILAVGAPAASARVYRGVMTNGGGAVHSGEQGALWRARFEEHRRGRVAYSACVIFRDEHAVSQCKPGRTSAHGVDRIDFSEFVNQHPGRWVVRFFELGRTLAAWRFTVRPEDA